MGTPPDDSENRVQFMRTGSVAPMGTLLGELGTKVDMDTAAAFRQRCKASNTDVAGALRNYVYKVVHGKTYEQLCIEASQRRESLLLGEGSIEGLIGDRT